MKLTRSLETPLAPASSRIFACRRRNPRPSTGTARGSARGRGLGSRSISLGHERVEGGFEVVICEVVLGLGIGLKAGGETHKASRGFGDGRGFSQSGRAGRCIPDQLAIGHGGPLDTSLEDIGLEDAEEVVEGGLSAHSDSREGEAAFPGEISRQPEAVYDGLGGGPGEVGTAMA